MHETFEMWHHRGGKVLQVKGEDKTRLYRMAVCCSSYHESTLSVDTVSWELELEEPPRGRVGLVNMTVWCLFSYFFEIWTMLTAIKMIDEVILDWLILHSCHIPAYSKRGLGYPNLANVLPSLSSQPLSRCRSTQGPRRWPVLLPVALESGLVFPSHRSFHACCACKSERATTRLLYTHREISMQQRGLSFMYLWDACRIL